MKYIKILDIKVFAFLYFFYYYKRVSKALDIFGIMDYSRVIIITIAQNFMYRILYM